MPLVVGTADGFTFPGEYTGQYGVYEAIKHMYSQNKDFKGLINEKSLYLNKNYFASDMEKLVESVKQDFRKRHDIPEKATVVFVAPGNEAKEAAFTMENTRKGIKEFILKYSAPTSLSPKAPPMNNFCTVLSLHKGSAGEKYVKEYLAEKEWHGRLIIVTNEENEHINAMAGSDFGLVHDG